MVLQAAKLPGLAVLYHYLSSVHLQCPYLLVILGKRNEGQLDLFIVL